MSIPPFVHAMNTVTRDVILRPIVEWINNRAPGPVTVEDLVAVLELPKPIPTINESSFVSESSNKKSTPDKLSFRLVPEEGKCNHIFLANKRKDKYCPRDAVPGSEFCREHSKSTPRRKDKPVGINPSYDPRNLANAPLTHSYANPDGQGSYVGTTTGIVYKTENGENIVVGKRDHAGHDIPLLEGDQQTSVPMAMPALSQVAPVSSSQVNIPSRVVTNSTSSTVRSAPQMPSLPLGFRPKPVV